MASSPVPSPADLGVRVGDFFTCSWGYDQTNTDFYKVVGVTPKGIKVQQWTSAVIGERGGPSESVVPGDGPATYRDDSAATPEMDFWDRQEVIVDRPKPVMQKRLRGNSAQPAFTVNSYSIATKWNGQAAHQTGAGWGH